MHLKVRTLREGRTEEPRAGRAEPKEEASFRVEDYAFQGTKECYTWNVGTVVLHLVLVRTFPRSEPQEEA